ncbi:hypothetical protein SLEP1_g25753 [Rubroshorea leprosula]|uniref:Uncharacterized protein n=1 Tax=Rubroshorea leprosula TaxID=152421 RepID=A0AAV5JW87_9ROSI|nr:hypothetical protein SLEP1_g25753 [Rubroshorea leprosula]
MLEITVNGKNIDPPTLHPLLLDTKTTENMILQNSSFYVTRPNACNTNIAFIYCTPLRASHTIINPMNILSGTHDIEEVQGGEGESLHVEGASEGIDLESIGEKNDESYDVENDFCECDAWFNEDPPNLRRNE